MNLVKYLVSSTLPSGKQVLFITFVPAPFDQYLLEANNKNAILFYFFLIRICLQAKI